MPSLASTVSQLFRRSKSLTPQEPPASKSVHAHSDFFHCADNSVVSRRQGLLFVEPDLSYSLASAQTSSESSLKINIGLKRHGDKPGPIWPKGRNGDSAVVLSPDTFSESEKVDYNTPYLCPPKKHQRTPRLSDNRRTPDDPVKAEAPALESSLPAGNLSLSAPDLASSAKPQSESTKSPTPPALSTLDPTDSGEIPKYKKPQTRSRISKSLSARKITSKASGLIRQSSERRASSSQSTSIQPGGALPPAPSLDLLPAPQLPSLTFDVEEALGTLRAEDSPQASSSLPLSRHASLPIRERPAVVTPSVARPLIPSPLSPNWIRSRGVPNNDGDRGKVGQSHLRRAKSTRVTPPRAPLTAPSGVSDPSPLPTTGASVRRSNTTTSAYSPNRSCESSRIVSPLTIRWAAESAQRSPTLALGPRGLHRSASSGNAQRLLPARSLARAVSTGGHHTAKRAGALTSPRASPYYPGSPATPQVAAAPAAAPPLSSTHTTSNQGCLADTWGDEAECLTQSPDTVLSEGNSNNCSAGYPSSSAAMIGTPGMAGSHGPIAPRDKLLPLPRSPLSSSALPTHQTGDGGYSPTLGHVATCTEAVINNYNSPRNNPVSPMSLPCSQHSSHVKPGSHNQPPLAHPPRNRAIDNIQPPSPLATHVLSPRPAASPMHPPATTPLPSPLGHPSTADWHGMAPGQNPYTQPPRPHRVHTTSNGYPQPTPGDAAPQGHVQNRLKRNQSLGSLRGTTHTAVATGGLGAMSMERELAGRNQTLPSRNPRLKAAAAAALAISRSNTMSYSNSPPLAARNPNFQSPALSVGATGVGPGLNSPTLAVGTIGRRGKPSLVHRAEVCDLPPAQPVHSAGSDTYTIGALGSHASLARTRRDPRSMITDVVVVDMKRNPDGEYGYVLDVSYVNDRKKHQLLRSFDDIEFLHLQLLSRYGPHMVPALPERVTIGKETRLRQTMQLAKFTKQRKIDIRQYLLQLAWEGNDRLLNDEFMLGFFERLAYRDPFGQLS